MTRVEHTNTLWFTDALCEGVSDVSLESSWGIEPINRHFAENPDNPYKLVEYFPEWRYDESVPEEQRWIGFGFKELIWDIMSPPPHSRIRFSGTFVGDSREGKSYSLPISIEGVQNQWIPLVLLIDKELYTCDADAAKKLMNHFAPNDRMVHYSHLQYIKNRQLE